MNKILKRIGFTVGLFLVLTNVNLIAQIDTLFWFAVPNVCNNHSGGDNVQELRLASFNATPVTVTIDIPANPSFTPRVVTIPSGGLLTETFNKADLEIPNNNIASNTGLRVRASQLITAYYEIGRGTENTDIFSMKGTNALGIRFYTVFQTEYETDTRFYPEAQSSINIVAIDNNTLVTITLPTGKTAAGWGSDVTRTILLQKGQTYSFASSSALGANRLTGTLITSTRPIAVTTSDDSIKMGGSADLAGDQLVPVNVVGTEYLIPPGLLAGNDGDNTAYIVAIENNTSIEINGSFIVNLSAGQSYAYKMPDPPNTDSRFLKSSNPVYVSYLSGFGTEVGSPLLPTIKCTGSNRVGFIRSTDKPFYLTILAQDEAIGNFIIEGGGANQDMLNNLANYFSNASFPGWKVFQKEFSTIPSNVSITIQNSKAYFHLGIINGTESSSASFGYFSDYGKLQTALPPTLSACPNTTVVLDPQLFGTFTSKIWKRNGNPFSGGTVDDLTGKLTFLVPPTEIPGVPDQYRLELKDSRSCQFEDTVRLTVFAKADIALNTEGNRSICSNDPNAFIIASQVTGTITNYQWKYFAPAATSPSNPGNPFPSTPPTQHLPKVAGIYRVIGTDNNTCQDSAQVNITYNTAVLGTFNKPTSLVCANVIPELVAVAKPPAAANYVFSKYSWKFNGTEYWTQAKYKPQANSGAYSLDVEDQNGCKSSDNVILTFVNPSSLSLNLLSPTICSAQNSPITMTTNAPTLQSLTWFLNGNSLQSGVNNRTWVPIAVGTYKVDLVDNNACPSTASVAVTKFSTTVTVVLNTPASPFCSNSNDVLSHATPAVTPNFKTYQWQKDGTNISGADKSTYQPTQPGTYRLQVTDNNDCPSSDQKTINWQVAQTFNLGNDQNVVCTNSYFNIVVNGSFSSLVWKFNTNIFTPTSGIGGKTHKPILGQSGTYEVSGKDANGCNASDAVVIGKVVDSTKLSLTQPPNNVCSNAGFKIDVSPNNLPTYNWFFNNVTAPAPNASASYIPRASGTYRVVAIDANTCTTSEKVTVNFVDTLALNLIAPPPVFCANNFTYRITPSGGSFVSYVFKRNNQIISPITGPGNSHRPTQSGVYLVEATDSRNCISRRNVTINYKDTANFSLPPLPTIICDNANGNNTTTIIDATGPYTDYKWFLNNVSITPNISASKHRPTTKGKYTVTVTDANTCTATNSVSANYFLPLTMKLTPSPTGTVACWNTNYTLTPTAGFNTYEWKVTSTPIVNIPINTFIYKPLQSGKYKVIGTDANTCKSADSIDIKYITDFKLNLGGVKAVCNTVGSFNIDATKPNIVRYDWSNNKGLTNPPITQSTFSVSQPGKYAVKLTDNNGCMDQDTLDFQQVAQLPLELGTKPFACSYENYEVDATANYQTYVWTNTAGLPNPSTSASKFKVTKSGVYKVTVTDASGTCTATDDITISYVEDLGFELNNNFTDTICFNDFYPSRYILAKDSLKFTNIPYTWTWSVPNGEPQPGNIVKHQPGSSGRYIVKVTDKSNQCFDSDTVNVSFSKLLANFDLGNPNDTVCYNVRDSITSTLIEYRNTTQFIWAWKVENGAVNPGAKTVAYPDRTGKYLATLTDRFKCRASDSVFVQFSDSLIDFDLGPATEKICISVVGDQKTIKATKRRYDNTTFYKWAWTVPTNQVQPGNVSEVTPVQSGDYAVLITDKWGCKNSDLKNIEYYNDLFGFKIRTPKDTICFNDPLVDLTAKATYRKFDNLAIYEWKWTAPTNSKITRLDSNAIVTDTSGKYFALIVNKENKCSNRDSIKIVFSDSLKNLQFTDPFDTICFNSDIDRKTIEASDKKYNDLKYYTWKWTLPNASNPGNVSSIKPQQSGSYSALVTDVYGCKASATAIINYSNDLFGFNLGPGIDTICFNVKKTLTDTAFAKPQYTWQWTVKPRTNIKVLNDNKIQPDSTGIYIAVVKNTFECFNSDTVDVIFSDSLLAFALGKPSDTICYNADSLKKMITTKVSKYKNLNEYSWEWIVPNGSRNPGNDFYAIPSKSGSFTATVKDRWKCEARSVTVVNFSNDLFGFDLGKPADTVCFNLPKTITSTLDTFRTNYYTWEWIKVPANAIAPNGAKTYQPKVSGTYTVKITNKEKCDNRDSVDITFSNALEAFSLGALKDTVCYNKPADSLQATDPKYNDLTNFKWKWDVPNGQVNVGNYYKIFPRVSGPFTATVNDKWECEVAKSVQVIYGDSVKIGLNNADTTACSYTNYIIDAGSGYVKYEWNIPNYTFPTYRPSVTGKYTVKVTDRFGCTGSDSVNVRYVPEINTQLLPIKDICDSDSLNESGIIYAASGFDTYKWMDNPIGIDTFYRPTFPQFNGNSINNKVSLTVTLDICTANASVDVTFIKKDNKYLGPDTIVCLDKPVVLDAGPNFYSYVWKSTNSGDSILSNSREITVNLPGFYYVDLVSKCGNLRPTRQIDNFDTIQFNFIPDKELCIGEKLDVKNLSHKVEDKYHYTWYEKMTQTYIDDTTSSITVERDGNYQVIVRDINKCVRMDSIQVVMTDDCFTIPNLFTPNGDEENPTFFIRGIYKGEWELEVYNRWGDRVYLNSKYDNSWTGDDLAAGVYYYELRNPLKAKKYKGWVQIAK